MSFRKRKKYLYLNCPRCRGWGKFKTADGSRIPCKDCTGSGFRNTLIRDTKKKDP